jgi:hypothetical protein
MVLIQWPRDGALAPVTEEAARPAIRPGWLTWLRNEALGNHGETRTPIFAHRNGSIAGQQAAVEAGRVRCEISASSLSKLPSFRSPLTRPRARRDR